MSDFLLRTLDEYKSNTIAMKTQMSLILGKYQGLDLSIPANEKSVHLMTGYRIVIGMTIDNFDKLIKECHENQNLDEPAEIQLFARALKQMTNAEFSFDNFNSARLF